MDCIRNHLKIWSDGVFIVFVIAFFLAPKYAWGAFASQFSLTAGEQYSDNIFFDKRKEHDFVTIITPTFSLLHAPEGQIAPTLNVNFSPRGQIFARHAQQNSFGKDFSLDGVYTYRYSPRVNFSFADSLQRFGQTRTGGLGSEGFVQLTGPTTSPPSPGGTAAGSRSSDLKDFISRGDQITNSVSLQGSYLYRPDVSFSGGYVNTYTN